MVKPKNLMAYIVRPIRKIKRVTNVERLIIAQLAMAVSPEKG